VTEVLLKFFIFDIRSRHSFFIQSSWHSWVPRSGPRLESVGL